MYWFNIDLCVYVCFVLFCYCVTLHLGSIYKKYASIFKVKAGFLQTFRTILYAVRVKLYKQTILSTFHHNCWRGGEIRKTGISHIAYHYTIYLLIPIITNKLKLEIKHDIFNFCITEQLFKQIHIYCKNIFFKFTLPERIRGNFSGPIWKKIEEHNFFVFVLIHEYEKYNN